MASRYTSSQTARLTPDRFLKLPLSPLESGKQLTYGKKTCRCGKRNSLSCWACRGEDRNRRRAAGRRKSRRRCCADQRRWTARSLQRFRAERGQVRPQRLPLWRDRDSRRQDRMGVAVERLCCRQTRSTFGQGDEADSARAARVKTESSSHPTAMLLSPDERRLYVTLANRDAVAVIDAKIGQG